MFKALKIENLKLKIVFFVISLILILNSSPVNAASFTSAYLRLNTQSANSALSGTVCAKASASGAGTENKIAVTFPSTFTVSTTASNWTTTTTNLPVGSSAWPGIGAVATTVSSKTVTFASSDLTSTSLYCFNFTGASSTTGAAGTDKTGTITSTNSSDVVIDQTTYSVAIVSSSNVSVTANVDPQVSDLPIDIVSTTVGSNFPQNTTLNYQITYGNSGTTPIPLTIQAEWTQGTISGNPSPSVDVLGYVTSSASNAYGAAVPVINTVNRTITWTISSIPASTTGQTATFSLRTTSNYTGGSIVTFSVLARATSGSTTTPDDSVNQSYLFFGTSNPGGPGDGLSDGKTDGKTDGRVGYLLFRSIEIISISKSQAQIRVSLINKSNLTVSYGTSLNSLSKIFKTIDPKTDHIVTLSELNPETDYYFKINANDIFGNKAVSDVFTFKTAGLSPVPTVDLANVIVTSNNNVLLSPQIRIGNKLKSNIVVIPRQSVFTIQFTLDKNIVLKSIQAILRNKKVLGFSTLDEVSAGSNYVNLVETSPGVYTGKIATGETEGQYEVYVRLIDFNGNILEQKILDLSITNKFKVLAKGTDKPIENARVLLSLYNQTTKTYFVISSQILPIQNPIYSTPDGRYNIVLPLGKYKADISAIGYNPKTIEFEINQYSQGYPIVYLEQNFNILNTINYYFDVLIDAINESQDYLKQRSDSNRLFDLSAFSAVFMLLILSILSVSARTHVSVFYLPYFLIFKLMILLRKNKDKIIFGRVINEKTKSPITRAVVNILSVDNKNIVATLKTNKLGEFYFNNPNNSTYQVQVIKERFDTLTGLSTKDFPMVFKLKTQTKQKNSPAKILSVYFEDFLGMGMEALILIGLLVQIYSIAAFGFIRVLPFIVITILNLILMFTYLYKPKRLEN